jgi:DNA-binding NarL/FixJ family response regulator
MRALHVLLVEGHPAVRYELARRLRHMPGIDLVGVAGTPAEALACVSCWRPSAVVCDPRSCSKAPLSLVRCLDTMGTRVVVLTTSLRDGDAQDLQEAGAAAVLLKGCPMLDLQASLLAAPPEAPRRRSAPKQRGWAILP